MTKSAKTATKSQVEKFREAARKLGTDDSEEHFDQLVKKIAKGPTRPQDRDKKTK